MARIGVDLDGPVYNYNACLWAYRQMVTRDWNTPMPASTCWNFFRENWGMTLEEYLDLHNTAAAHGWLFDSQPPHPGVCEALGRLKSAGHSLHIITHRTGPGADENTCRWLRRYSIPFDTLTFAADKTLIPTDFFIEDKVENAEALAVTSCLPVIIDRPWNQEWDGARAYTWGDFEAYIERHIRYDPACKVAA